MGEVAIAASLHGKDYIRLLFAMSKRYSLFGRQWIAPAKGQVSALEIPAAIRPTHLRGAPILEGGEGPGRAQVSEVGILIMDDDLASQQALKLILDSEGWRVRIVPVASQAMSELASGMWDLAIVNVTLLDMAGPVFSTLTELVQAQMAAREPATTQDEQKPRAKRFRALFLVPLMGSKEVPLILEREGLPYSFTPRTTCTIFFKK
jgi:CheY-like chemotaxis protein